MSFLQQPGTTYHRDKTGLVRYTLLFSTDEAGYGALQNFIPSSIPPKVNEIDRRATLQQDGSWQLAINYGGGEKELFKEDVDLDWAGAEDPIETHPDFDKLAKKYKALFDPQETAKFTGWDRKIKDPQGSGMIPNPFYGFSHFLNDGAVLRLTFNLEKYDAKFLKNICKIEVPKISDSQLKPMAEAPDGKNWLKKSVKVKFCGGCFQYTLEYLLSGPGGWIPDVYKPKNPGGAGI